MLAIHIVPSFHYDVAYLKPFQAYLPDCFQIINEALDLLERHSEYRFLIEQVLLLEEYWKSLPARRDQLVRLARDGRLAVAPGMYVMPDMNHPDGESLFQQIKAGKDWLREHLAIDPQVCWIADCWGHHAQLPQILSQAGYTSYVFWRCMRRDVLRTNFRWRGLDGTIISTHWLARSYSSVDFPAAQVENALDLNLSGCGIGQIQNLCDGLLGYGSAPSVLLCNGGDMLHPQPSAPDSLRLLNASGKLPPVRFSTPEEFLSTIPWPETPIVEGEFNSAFQGSFTTNISIKQTNRRLTSRLLALEARSVVAGRADQDYSALWKPVLKQQFHDIICGTITDEAIQDCEYEHQAADAAIAEAEKTLDQTASISAFFNPLAWNRTEILQDQIVSLPALGYGTARPLAKSAPGTLPCGFANEFYTAKIGADGDIASLVENTSGAELVNSAKGPWGRLGLQVDNGDSWLNFAGPLSGGSTESALTQNEPDPWDRSTEGEIVQRQTMTSSATTARILSQATDHLIVEQTGTLSFWRISVPFITTIRFARHTARIEYQTTIHPSGRQYRIRVGFPTTVTGIIRHEIPFGIQERGPHEHVAQNWIDLADSTKGMALLNRGTPASNADDGTLLLTLFRSAAMEYKTESTRSFAEGIPHTFDYAILPHPPESDVSILRQGKEFNQPPQPCRIAAEQLGASGWTISPGNVQLSALRWSRSEIFVRVYEAIGQTTQARLDCPPQIRSCAHATGLERATDPYETCEGGFDFVMKPYEIQAFLLRTGEAKDAADS
ncbi:MAG TPA: glycoside hydrolase family 38 C-terminal domain-containing protein [Terrimicrobiaceae bacterium]|nr:glycoside hydrolase family 38 C-terminal domain-containing protein [Terrimicrobiaceae bacterium]